jgi:hypothetical protein
MINFKIYLFFISKKTKKNYFKLKISRRIIIFENFNKLIYLYLKNTKLYINKHINIRIFIK